MARCSLGALRRCGGSLVVCGLLLLVAGCTQINGYAMNQSGRSAYTRGDYRVARMDFQHAVAANPRNPDYHNNLAVVLKKQGDYLGAEREFQQAIRLNPNHRPAYHGLANMLRERNRMYDAQNMLQNWANRAPDRVEPQLELAWLKRQSGDLAGAQAALHVAMSRQPRNPVIMAQLGQVYQDQGQTNQAVYYYRRSLQSNWQQPEVRQQLATLERVPPTPAAGFYQSFPQNSPTLVAGNYGAPVNREMMKVYLPAQGTPTPVAAGEPTLAEQPEPTLAEYGEPRSVEPKLPPLSVSPVAAAQPTPVLPQLVSPIVPAASTMNPGEPTPVRQTEHTAGSPAMLPPLKLPDIVHPEPPLAPPADPVEEPTRLVSEPAIQEVRMQPASEPNVTMLISPTPVFHPVAVKAAVPLVTPATTPPLVDPF